MPAEGMLYELKPNVRHVIFSIYFVPIAWVTVVSPLSAEVKHFREGFEGPKTSWTVHYDKSRLRIISHFRNDRIFVEGRHSESVFAEASRAGAVVQFQHNLPRARIFDELNLSLRMRSDRNGAVLLVRIVFPHQQDPETGTTLTTYLRGDTYGGDGGWQRLQCKTLSKRVQERLVLLRARLDNQKINLRDAYVDRAIVTARLEPGPAEFFLDQLEFGPIITPETDDAALVTKPAVEGASTSVEFRLDRLLVNGRPFFPRIAAYHSENIARLKETGLNVIWVPDHQDKRLLSALRKEGLWATATPPRAVDDSGNLLDAQDAGLVAFSKSTEPILFWNLGTRMPGSARRELVSWAEQIRLADRQRQRPFMVDVISLERTISRDVPMLGVSRHALNTTLNPKEYRDLLIQKRRLARPGTFMWTWIQTEPSRANAEARFRSGFAPIVIEPEQIGLQVYAALAAGYRGVGYWKTTSFDEALPGALERRLAITQLNLELELLEPWLATGNPVEQVEFVIEKPKSESIIEQNFNFRNSQASRKNRDPEQSTRTRETQRNQKADGELEAVLIRSNFGLLLLPIWYEHNSQFVPGQMAANDASIIVPPGVGESASAWEITTTGVRSLDRRRVTGGIRLTLSKFDRTAAVILTSDRALIARLREKVRKIAEKSAQVSVELARTKLTRVRLVDEELRQLGVGQADAPQLLARSEQLIRQSETALERSDFHAARQLSRDALQMQRILQRAYWDDAVRTLSSPVSSPHTVCFQTLPDHWRMVGRIGRSQNKTNDNLLRSGDFEDVDTMVVEGWKHSQKDLDGIRAAAELYPTGREGTYCLRLIAVAASPEETPPVVTTAPVTVTSPKMLVRRGQIVHASGWVRVVAAVTGNPDGCMLYDNLGGAVSALRFRKPGKWQRFVIVREVHETGDFSINLVLKGLGEVQFDDLQVTALTPQDAKPTGVADQSPTRATGIRPRAMEFFNRLPRLTPQRARRE